MSPLTRANLLRPPVADDSQEVRSAETSDLHGCAVAPIEAAGIAAFCEVKAPGEKPRPLQLHRMEQLRKLGFRVYVVDSEEKIKKVISEGVQGFGTSGKLSSGQFTVENGR